MAVQRPLMLKDFLELDLGSDSCSSFHCVPRSRIATAADVGAPTSIRFLLEAELRGGGDRRSLPRSRSKGTTLTKITAAINNAVKNLPISSPTRIRPKARAGAGAEAKPIAVLRKLLGRSFWRRSDKEEEKVRVKDIVRLNSFELYGERRTSLYFPSPVASSCSSCSGASDNNSSTSSSSSSVSDSLLSSGSSFFDCSGGVGETKRKDSSQRSPNRAIAGADKTSLSVGNDKIKEEENKEGGDSEIEQEEKEQFSPASVIDFPFQEEEEDKEEEEEEEEDDDDDDDKDEEEDEDDKGNNRGTSSPRFEQSLANIERTRHHLLQKIRRFECLADLDSVDLSESFSNLDEHVSSEEEEEVSAWSLIGRLRSVGPHKKLLHDFFREELTWTTDVEGLLRAAECYIQGGGHLTAEDHGKAQIGEIERNGRWRCFEDDTKEVATEVEARMLGSLLEELVLDLVSWS